MELSRFFTLAEMTHSDTAQSAGIRNEPGAAETTSLRALCTAVLDPLRESIGQAIRINSVRIWGACRTCSPRRR